MIRIQLPEYAYLFERWDFVNHRKSIENVINNRGVYVLFDEDGDVLYVGKSRRLTSRLVDHINGRGSSNDFAYLITRIGVMEVEKLAELDIYESYAIDTLRPRYNRDKVFYKSEDIAQIEFELLLADGEVTGLEDVVEALIDEGYSTLQQEDLRIAKEELRVARQEKTRLLRKLDDIGLLNDRLSIITK